MFITELEVKNFKSFEHLNIKLKRFNVLIGANASGKSNFVDIFRFLRDIGTDGLRGAIAFQGGTKYLRNIRNGVSEDIFVRIKGENRDWSNVKTASEKVLKSRVSTFEFSFSVATFDKSPAFNVTDEKISLTYDIVKTRRVGESIDEAIIESGGELNIRRDDNGKIIPTYSEPFDEGIRDLVEIFSSREEIPRAALMIQSPQLYYLGMNFPFEDIGVYDFQPKLLKNSTSNKQRVRLAEDGVNFGVALKEIIQGAEKRRMFLNLVKSVISFVDDIQVEDYSSESLQILLKETIADSTYLPAWLVSDGTINVAALVAALYFEDGNVKVIEEPEKNIHPRLIGRLVPLLQEVAEKKQVIVTTHSPEVVKYAGKDSLCLIQRDKSGNSTACWPGDSKTLKIFLEEDIGLDDLFVDELIGL